MFEEIRDRIRRRGLKVEELVQAAGSRQEWKEGESIVRQSDRINRR